MKISIETRTQAAEGRMRPMLKPSTKQRTTVMDIFHKLEQLLVPIEKQIEVVQMVFQQRPLDDYVTLSVTVVYAKFNEKIRSQSVHRCEELTNQHELAIDQLRKDMATLSSQFGQEISKIQSKAREIEEDSARIVLDY